jgi:hypothetical protein
MSARKSNAAALVAPLQPSGLSHYGGHFFKGTLPCESCGAASVSYVDLVDEYDRTLQREARRIVEHASDEINRGMAGNAAGMLRDAARLLDLLGQRQSARDQAKDEAKDARLLARRKAAQR